MTTLAGLGRRYAKALLELAIERGEVDRIQRDLATLAAAWKDQRELRAAFENPKIGPDVRRRVLDAIIQRLGASTTLKNTLFLLSDRRRMRHLPDIASAFAQLSEERAGRVRAEVVSATPLSDAYCAELQKVLSQVTGKEVVLHRREDPSLIAGVVTRIGDQVFDGSLRTRLEELKDEMLHR